MMIAHLILLAALASAPHLASGVPPTPAADTVAVGGAAGSAVDCAEAYGKAATCEVVPCDALYATFLGQWSGPFEEYVQEQSTPDKPVFRPYDGAVSYAANDCLLNPASGERFIIGRSIDTYPAFGALPAKTDKGLLITGKHGDGSAFLRRIDHNGAYDYTLESKEATTETAIWRLDVPAAQRPCPTAADAAKVCSSPARSFRVTDGRDLTAKPANVRNVTIEMTVGPAAAPYWHGVIARGHHQRHES